jgi:hypothetical protein
MPRKGKNWEPDGELWERYLRRLDPNPELAAERYTQLHKKFSELAWNHGSRDPEGFADIVLKRLAVKLDEVEVPSAEIERYAFAIARFALKEDSRRRFRFLSLDYWMDHLQNWFPPQIDEECLGWVLQQLPADVRDLLSQYSPGETPEGGLAQHRRQLARQLGITDGALRKRVEEAKKKARLLYLNNCEKK